MGMFVWLMVLIRVLLLWLRVRFFSFLRRGGVGEEEDFLVEMSDIFMGLFLEGLIWFVLFLIWGDEGKWKSCLFCGVYVLRGGLGLRVKEVSR